MDEQTVVSPELAVEETAIPELASQCPPVVVAYLGDRWRRSRYSIFVGITNGLKRAETKPLRETVKSQREKVDTFLEQRNAKIMEWLKDGKDVRADVLPILTQLDKANKSLEKAQKAVQDKAKPFTEKVKDHNASIKMIDGREKGQLETIMGQPCEVLETVSEEDKQALEAAKATSKKKSL
jgi:hypothetical protein